MTKLILAAVIAFLLLLAGTILILDQFGPPRTYVLEIDSKPGMEIVGELEADGAARKIEETLPAKITVEARRIAFAFVPKEGKADAGFGFTLTVDGTVLVGGKISGPPGIVGHAYKPRVFWRRPEFLVGGMANEAEAERVRLRAEERN